MSYGEWLSRTNAFVEDTCVILAVAFILARGKVLDWIVQSRKGDPSIPLGIVLGLIGSSEALFPLARLPYLTSSLVASFAATVGDYRIGVITILTVGVSFAIAGAPVGMIAPIAGFAVSAVMVAAFRRFGPKVHWSIQAFLIGGFSQGLVVVLERFVYTAPMEARIATIPANGFGLVLLLLVFREAEMRVESEHRRLELERMQILVRDAQLTALRARIRPHFLFNALTSIAALCVLDSKKAERAIIALSGIMRRSLQVKLSANQPLDDEIAYVRSYTDIEQLRMGDRLKIEWSIDPSVTKSAIPPFVLQTLVENAVVHGIGASGQAGTVRISIRRLRGRILLAVQDNGSGFTPTVATFDRSSSEHGLGLINAQLTFLYGNGSRVRVFSSPGKGTIAAFSIPHWEAV